MGMTDGQLMVSEYPGDGLPKPVAFPPPETVVEFDAEGLPYTSLPSLLELKMASGMTAPQRMQDLADVMNLIRINHLPPELATQLNPYVQEKFIELWNVAQIREDY